MGYQRWGNDSSESECHYDTRQPDSYPDDILWSIRYLFVRPGITEPYHHPPGNMFLGDFFWIEEAIECAKDTAGTEGDVTILFYTTYKFSNLMWYEKFPVGEFSTQVVYDDNALSEWAEMRSFRQFHYVNSLDEVTPDSVYILPSTYKEAFVDKGFNITDVNDRYCVAAP